MKFLRLLLFRLWAVGFELISFCGTKIKGFKMKVLAVLVGAIFSFGVSASEWVDAGEFCYNQGFLTHYNVTSIKKMNANPITTKAMGKVKEANSYVSKKNPNYRGYADNRKLAHRFCRKVFSYTGAYGTPEYPNIIRTVEEANKAKAERELDADERKRASEFEREKAHNIANINEEIENLKSKNIANREALSRRQPSLKYIVVKGRRDDGLVYGYYANGRALFIHDKAGIISRAGRIGVELIENKKYGVVTVKRKNGFTEDYQVMETSRKGVDAHAKWLESSEGVSALKEVKDIDKKIELLRDELRKVQNLRFTRDERESKYY